MSDQEKAQRLLDRASRVMSMAERDLCEFIRDNRKMDSDEMHEFRNLCERHAAYLK